MWTFQKEIIMHSFSTVQPGRHMHCCEPEYSLECLETQENVKELGIMATGKEVHKKHHQKTKPLLHKNIKAQTLH